MTARPPLQPLVHQAILASAGTGKTHALAHRFIGLLGRGVEADRICALTFSRKAATEIFDNIAGYLVEAAQCPDAARKTGSHAGLAGLTPAEAGRLLRGLVSRLHRVHIGTLDSFIVSVVRAFSSELGLPSDFSLLESGSVEARQLTEESLAFLLAPGVSHSRHREAFYEAFKKATYGREEKGFSAAFFDVLEKSLGLFRRFPDPDRWGNPAPIWRVPPDWLTEHKIVPEDTFQALLKRVEAGLALPDTVIESLQAAASFKPFNAWKTAVFENTAMKKLFAALPTLDNGLELVFNRRTYPIDPVAGRLVASLLRHLVRQEIVRAWTQTQGLGSMLGHFHAVYEATIRRRGALTFNDAQFLLTPANTAGAGVISRQPHEAERLYIDYRLDAQLDHWLLDEFQDTSDLQWATLDNLASEIIQDASGRRSFFMVGDTKQAIHAWRGGNARLFDELLDRYGTGIAQTKLSASYRSTAPVLELVNRLFSELDGFDFPDDTLQRWRKTWERHVSQVDKPGCAAWLEPVAEDDNPPDPPSLLRASAGLIRELNPVGRGLSIAILLPTNKACTEAADCLRHELAADRIPIVNEGAAGLADNPVVALMRSLLRLAAHPGDTLAEAHIRMSPLGSMAEEAGDRFPLLLLHRIQSEGLTAFFRHWSDRLEGAIGPLDEFGSKRMHDLLALAAEADADGQVEPDAFVALLDSRELREQTSGGAVRIMTIHQAKGLGFDAVLLPLTGNSDLAAPGALDLVHGGSDHHPWVLKMPRKIVAQSDPVLLEKWRDIVAETVFSNLCVFYVALTRARQGLYVLTSYGRKKRSGNRALTEGIFMSRRLLGTDKPEAVEGETLAAGGFAFRCLYREGDWNWASAIPVAQPEHAAAAAPVSRFPAQPPREARLKRVEPSKGDGESRRADWLFKPESRGVLDFGSMIHALLAKVEWSEGADAELILAGWKPDRVFSEDVQRDAAFQFRALLAAPEVKQALARPSGPVSLWREMAFELVDGSDWISGVFDRVVVRRNPAGQAVHAVVMDFKSNRIESESDMPAAAALYDHQLRLYRRALSRILRLADDDVEIQILFTRMARLYRVPPPGLAATTAP